MKHVALAVAIQAALLGSLVATHLTASAAWLALVSIAIVAIEVTAQRTDDRPCRSSIDRLLAVVTGASTALALLGGPAALATAPAPLARVALGGTIALGGAALRAAAIATLGEAFVTEAVAPELLVTGGVFGRLRHPSELGAWLLVGGFAIAATGWATLAATAGVIASGLVRVRREDERLATAFGASFRAYRAAVRAFLPRVRLPRA